MLFHMVRLFYLPIIHTWMNAMGCEKIFFNRIQTRKCLENLKINNHLKYSFKSLVIFSYS